MHDMITCLLAAAVAYRTGKIIENALVLLFFERGEHLLMYQVVH